MKNLCIVLLQGLFFCLSVHARYKVDGIKSVVYGETETQIITESEVARPGLDGQPKTFDELIFEYLVFLDAKRIGAVPDGAAMEKHWEEVKKQNKLSEDDMMKLASQAGYTLQEAKAQLGKMSAISQMFDFKVRSSLFVPKQEVECYYNAHPEVEPAEYEIVRALVPYSDLEPKNEMKKRLSHFAKTGKGNVRLVWSEPFVLMHDEIASDKQYIYTMKIGQTSQPSETLQGFEMFKLVSKKPERLVPLSERYNKIENELKSPKFQELMEAYKKELYDKATIVMY
ncbi:MAG: hypothetical protein WD055_03455 [Candidatus Dependentiae bacterium]